VSINGNKDSDYETFTEIYSSTEIIDQIGSNKNTYTSLPIRGRSGSNNDFETQFSTKVVAGSSVSPKSPVLSSVSSTHLRSSSSSSSLPLTSTRHSVVSNIDHVHVPHKSTHISSQSSLKHSKSSAYEPFISTIRPMPQVSTLVAPPPPKKPWPMRRRVLYPPTDAYTKRLVTVRSLSAGGSDHVSEGETGKFFFYFLS
jgi:hypothetical protein